ncbi:MAG: hypothetical protein ABI288_00745 [Ginsengibacter sp.]
MIKIAASTVSSINTLTDSKCFLKLRAANIIATIQHTREIACIIFMFLSHSGKKVRYVSICSSASMPLYLRPMEDHIMNNTKGGNKKMIARTAVSLLGTWDLVDIFYDFSFKSNLKGT